LAGVGEYEHDIGPEVTVGERSVNDVTDFAFDSDTVNAIAVRPDGRIVAAGTDYSRFSFDDSSDTDFALARYLPDGTPDTSFGPAGSGVVVRDFTDFRPGNNDEASSLALMPDGKIVVGGTQGVVVYNGDGTPYDPTGAAAVRGQNDVDAPGRRAPRGAARRLPIMI